MPTLPRQTEHVAYRTGTYSAGPARQTSSPMPHIPARSKPTPPVREPTPPQGKHLKAMIPLFGYIVLAGVVMVIGLVYISGYVLVTQERNRTEHLQKFLKQEDDRKTRNQELIARLEAQPHLEALAAQLHMVHAADRPPFIVGVTKTLPILTPTLPDSSLPVPAPKPTGSRHN